MSEVPVFGEFSPEDQAFLKALGIKVTSSGDSVTTMVTEVDSAQAFEVENDEIFEDILPADKGFPIARLVEDLRLLRDQKRIQEDETP